MVKDRDEDKDDSSGEGMKMMNQVKRKVFGKGRSIEWEENIVKAFWFVGRKKCEKTVVKDVFLVLDRKYARLLTRQPWTSKHFPVNKIRSTPKVHSFFDKMVS